MRNKILVANWKMNKDWNSAISLIDNIENTLNKSKPISDVKIVIAPPFPYLEYANRKNKFSIAAQNCHAEEYGSYTGEVSVPMLKSIGVEYIILGHSERRKYFEESNQIISQKIASVLEYGIKPILCCGEPWETRKKNEHITFVNTQIINCLENIEDHYIKNIIIAYEPIWAIGTDKIPQSEEIENMHSSIRKNLENLYGSNITNLIPIIYGGNLNSNNAKEILKCDNVDGGLVGRASLNTDNFLEILDCF